MSIFPSKKVCKFLIKIYFTKISSKKDKEIEISPLMPIRVKLKPFGVLLSRDIVVSMMMSIDNKTA
jgi:hypothetical protein